MTGLLNWRGLERRWELVGTRTRGAVLLVDLENFRSLVDRHGRLAGHDLVRDAARLVRGMIGSQAVMGRLGSDTFVALVPNTSPDDTVQLRLEMGRRFDEFARSLPDPRPYLTVGAALWPQGGTDLRSLVAAAERNALERKRQQAKLTMSTKGHPGQGRMPRTFLSGWLTTSCDGVLITDPDLKVFYVNPAYERMTGYTMKEWLGKGPGFIASSKTPRTVYEEMWDSLNDSGAWTGKVVNRHRSGREWVSHLSITRVLDRSGRVTGYVGVARDVTEAAVDEETAPSEPGAAAEEAFTNEALAYSLAEAAQMHSGDTGEHLDRVKEFTRLLTVAAAGRGIRAFQSYRFRSAVTLASILHDVGKLAIPQGLLLKPGRLSVQEFELVKTHTLAGRQLLQSPFLRGGPSKAPSLFLEAASAIAGGHHEKWDGSGYPEGLAGRDIPMEARVVAIADVYDALRSWRPYKEPWSHDEAVAYIESQAGKHFDPDLVEVFASVSDEFDDVFGRMPDGYGMGTA